MQTHKVLEAIAVTAELCGRTFSPAAAAVFSGDLAGFPEEAVLAALTRCRKEVRGVLTIQDVVSRIDDGRPGVEQAWAMIPQDYCSSVVWSDEMAQAWGAANPLIQQGDKIGARMAFKEAYAKLVADARDQSIAPNWTPSFGDDKVGRQAALIDAVRHRRMTVNNAVALLPQEMAEGLLLSVGVTAHPLLAAPATKENKALLGALLLTLRVGS